jgi:hypothetical protein
VFLAFIDFEGLNNRGLVDWGSIKGYYYAEAGVSFGVALISGHEGLGFS